MYTRRFLCLLLLTICVLPGQKKKDNKPPEVELVECNVKRQEYLIVLDGRVKNVGEKPVKRLVIQFSFLTSEKDTLTTKLGSIESEVLDPGEEAEFHFQLETPAKATHYLVNFEDGAGKYLRPSKNGPFAID